MKAKKILSVFLALLTGTALAVPAVAEVHIGHITTEEGKKNTDIYIETGVNPAEEKYKFDDGYIPSILLRELSPYLSKGENCVINFYGQGSDEYLGEIIDETSNVSVSVLTEDYDWYSEDEFEIIAIHRITTTDKRPKTNRSNPIESPKKKQY